MKYLRLYESFNESEIDRICKMYHIWDYNINPDGSIDVNSCANLDSSDLTEIPIKFNKVNGWFDCNNNKLISLKNTPNEMGGYFNCSDNKLTSFEYAPKIIAGFSCNFNPIFQIWTLFIDWTKIELLNDYDIFRDEDTDEPAVIMDRLNDFLLEIGRRPVENVYKYKNI